MYEPDETMTGKRCVICNELNDETSSEDYDYWKVHEKCMGKYDAFVNLKDGTTRHLKGYQSKECVHQDIEEVYKNVLLSYTIREVR